MIAVSDARDSEAQPFVYLWSDPADAQKMKEQMEIAASTAVLTWVENNGTPELPDLIEQAFDTLTHLPGNA